MLVHDYFGVVVCVLKGAHLIIPQALKHYFMLDRGDLLLSFLDTAEDEMAKPLQQGSLPRLQTLLDLGEPCD